MPKISVIVPVYKVEPYLRRCVDSILAQTYKDYEIILVDDGSPDSCGQICDEYAKKFENIRVIHKENCGLSSARNAGIDLAFAESDSLWLTFIDSDDYIHPRYLELLFKAIVENCTQISACAYVETDDIKPINEKITEDVDIITPESFWLCKRASYSVVAVCKLYKKDLFENIRYPVGKLHEDEFTTHKLLFSCEKITYNSSELYYYYQNPNSIMGSSWSPRHLDGIEAVEEQLSFFKINGFKRAYKRSYIVLADVMRFNLLKAQECDKNGEYSEIIKELKKKLRRHIRKNYLHMPISYCNDIYILAYPRRKWLIVPISKLMKLLRRVARKILRRK